MSHTKIVAGLRAITVFLEKPEKFTVLLESAYPKGWTDVLLREGNAEQAARVMTGYVRAWLEFVEGRAALPTTEGSILLKTAEGDAWAVLWVDPYPQRPAPVKPGAL